MKQDTATRNSHCQMPGDPQPYSRSSLRASRRMQQGQGSRHATPIPGQPHLSTPGLGPQQGAL
jgi:hypothetical protein